MKRAVLIFAALVLLICGVAVLGQDGGTIPEGYDAIGPVMTCINASADKDTLWFTTTKPTGADAADWAAPLTIYKKARYGSSYHELTTQPCAVRLFAKEQFQARAYWKNGLSDPGAIYADSSLTGPYKWQRTIIGVIDSVKVWTADDDTVFAVPLYKWPEGVSVE